MEKGAEIKLHCSQQILFLCLSVIVCSWHTPGNGKEVQGLIAFWEWVHSGELSICSFPS